MLFSSSLTAGVFLYIHELASIGAYCVIHFRYLVLFVLIFPTLASQGRCRVLFNSKNHSGKGYEITKHTRTQVPCSAASACPPHATITRILASRWLTVRARFIYLFCIEMVIVAVDHCQGNLGDFLLVP